MMNGGMEGGWEVQRLQLECKGVYCSWVPWEFQSELWSGGIYGVKTLIELFLYACKVSRPAGIIQIKSKQIFTQAFEIFCVYFLEIFIIIEFWATWKNNKTNPKDKTKANSNPYTHVCWPGGQDGGGQNEYHNMLQDQDHGDWWFPAEEALTKHQPMVWGWMW